MMSDNEVSQASQSLLIYGKYSIEWSKRQCSAFTGFVLCLCKLLGVK